MTPGRLSQYAGGSIGWWFAGGIAAAAVLLFSALEARRRGTDQAEAQAGPSALRCQAIPGFGRHRRSIRTR
jgi:hypothetical protein